jgi:hypothetical protein
MAKPNGQPGTVSKILWHFTGGPKWNSRTECQSPHRKRAALAYQAFCSILRSKNLRLGEYLECARVIVPERHRYDREKKKTIVEKNVKVTLRSSRVCCLADIPIAHLRYHEHRYGRFAIGFHRDSIVKHGFNPVLYTLERTHLMHSLYKGLAELDSIDCSSAAYAALEVADYYGDCEHEDIDELRMQGDMASDAINDIERSIKYSHECISDVMAFVKTFSDDEFSSIYCEREWRSTESFKFSYSDVAMLILPQKVGKRSYCSEFISDRIKKLDLPRSVPVVSWEDLIEH